jgi:hypothetical protein
VAAGETCDITTSQPTLCFAGPNEQKICQACSNTDGPFCGPGLHCDDTTGLCGKMCCDDGDCDAGASCILGSFKSVPAVGLCRKGDATDCKAPATSPSQGQCFWEGG